MKLYKKVYRGKRMKNKVLLEENKKYKFDFSDLEYVWEMHDLTNNIML